MHRLLTALLVLSLAASAWADEETRPNTLTKEEAADGWLLLYDGETTFGWDRGDKPETARDVLVLQGEKATTTAFLNYELRFAYRIDKGGKDAPVKLVRDKEASIPLTRYDGWADAHFTFDGGSINGNVAYKDSGRDRFQQTSTGTRIEPRPIRFDVPKGVKLSLRNVKLRPSKFTEAFNGKNLTGWKKFPGRKSKFTVTKEGWLNIKDGPGDLQTTEAWADFVLQLDCRANGENLNSGVFFRCIPGEYQNGYEAQIQNQPAKEPKTYTVEEYDSKTHKLVNKKKIENWSRDYGTGAIYRRIPARRSAAKDREWFTMTVAVRGRHIATWVNGVQTVDWTDNRPENANARNGYRAEKGPISLQGHDPTTDLSFRNIRIADLSGKN